MSLGRTLWLISHGLRSEQSKVTVDRVSVWGVRRGGDYPQTETFWAEGTIYVKVGEEGPFPMIEWQDGPKGWAASWSAGCPYGLTKIFSDLVT